MRVWRVFVGQGETYSRWEPGYRGVAVFDTEFSAFGSIAVHRFFWETGKALETKICTATGCMDGTGKVKYMRVVAIQTC